MSARDVLIRCVDSCMFNGDSGDIADAVLREFAAAGYAVEQDWQPIETAPKDGTTIILHVDWEPLTVAGFWDVASGVWCVKWDSHPLNGGFYPVTHWRPLPTAPAAAKETQA